MSLQIKGVLKQIATLLSAVAPAGIYPYAVSDDVHEWKDRSFGYAQDDVHGCAKFVGGREPLAMTCMDALNSWEAGRMKVQNKRPVILSVAEGSITPISINNIPGRPAPCSMPYFNKVYPYNERNN